MDKVVKCVLLDVDNVLITEVVEVVADIGEPNCKLVNPYQFLQVSKLTDYFKNFKVFFTDDLNIKQIKTFRIFDKIVKNKQQPILVYDLSTKENKVFNKYFKIYQSQNQLCDLFNCQ